MIDFKRYLALARLRWHFGIDLGTAWIRFCIPLAPGDVCLGEEHMFRCAVLRLKAFISALQVDLRVRRQL